MAIPRLKDEVWKPIDWIYDKEGKPLVAMHWQNRFNNMVNRYNDIYRIQMPNITPHICRHTYCSNQAKAGMNPKTLQYLMGHSDPRMTMGLYAHKVDDKVLEARGTVGDYLEDVA